MVEVTTHLCIGGPMDGTRYDPVKDRERFIQQPEPGRLSFPQWVNGQKVRFSYTVRTVALDGARFTFWVPEGTETWVAIERLFAGYHHRRIERGHTQS